MQQVWLERSACIRYGLRHSDTYFVWNQGVAKFWFSLSTPLQNYFLLPDKTKREYTMCCFSRDYEYLFAGTTTGDIACILLKNRVIQRYITANSNMSSRKWEVAAAGWIWIKNLHWFRIVLCNTKLRDESSNYESKLRSLIVQTWLHQVFKTWAIKSSWPLIILTPPSHQFYS